RLRFRPAYAAPEICRAQAEQISPRTDVFHLALFCYCCIARLLPSGFAGAGLESFDFHFPAPRTFSPSLPPGLGDVFVRNLAIDPLARAQSPSDFMGALSGALAKIYHRWSYAGGTIWEIGGHTRTGEAKTALNGVN